MEIKDKNTLVELISDAIEKNPTIGSLKVGQEKLGERVGKLEAGQTKLEAGQAKLEAGQTKLEAGQAKLEAGQAKLETGQAKLEERMGRVEKGQLDIREEQHRQGLMVEAISTDIKKLIEITSNSISKSDKIDDHERILSTHTEEIDVLKTAFHDHVTDNGIHKPDC